MDKKRTVQFLHPLFSLLLIMFCSRVMLSAQNDRTKTDWMYEAKLGVSTHYIAGSKELEKMAGLFDARKIAGQLEQAGAGWFLFTLHHQSWSMMAPNHTYDQITGTGIHTASRDIPADLIRELDPKGIRIMLYLNLRLDPDSRCPEEVRESMGGWPPNDTLIENIARVYREFSLRYGNKVAGWWVDGPHHPDIRDSEEREKWFSILAGALRAGNPDALVSFNFSLIERWGMKRFTPENDYTAGETDTITYIPERRWVDGAQCHIWTFLGEFWGQPGTRFGDSALVDYAKKVVGNGGVLTFEVGTMAWSGRGTEAGSHKELPIGMIDPRQVEQVRTVRNAIQPIFGKQ